MTSHLALLWSCAAKSFAPGFHDPTLSGWILFALYVLATLAAARVALRAPFPAATRRRERALWVGLTLALALLTVNKQLDLQTTLTAALRCEAKNEGWYGERRFLQRDAILFLTEATGVMALVLVIWLRQTLRRNLLPVLGILLLAGFVLLRAISFHHVDQFLKTDILTVRLHRIIELSALVLILFGALRLHRPVKGRR